ncbi:hypothetical protein [Streptomyces mirabilis]|uniref:hypothetical protein n=1 Tax=Streptomyces mirabilis TaxID=68239 RepID=UPI0036895EE4
MHQPIELNGYFHHVTLMFACAARWPPLDVVDPVRRHAGIHLTLTAKPSSGWVRRRGQKGTAELAQLRTDVDHHVRAVNQLTVHNRQLLQALSQPDASVRALPT